MKKSKLFQVVMFVLLVVVFSSIGIIIKENFGFPLGIGFTMLVLPLILRLVRVKYWGFNNH